MRRNLKERVKRPHIIAGKLYTVGAVLILADNLARHAHIKSIEQESLLPLNDNVGSRLKLNETFSLLVAVWMRTAMTVSQLLSCEESLKSIMEPRDVF